MPTPQRELELNAARQQQTARELRQYLISASNELYLFTLLCEQSGRPLPPALKRAHSSIRSELKRLEAETSAGAAVGASKSEPGL